MGEQETVSVPNFNPAKPTSIPSRPTSVVRAQKTNYGKCSNSVH